MKRSAGQETGGGRSQRRRYENPLQLSGDSISVESVDADSVDLDDEDDTQENVFHRNGGILGIGGPNRMQVIQEVPPEELTIGWICALPKELIPATLLLDQEFDIATDPEDDNIYHFGLMGDHKVVIATLPVGDYGQSSAAGVVRNMLRSFNGIKSCILVGIAGGIPSEENDIHLGDVVVSTPSSHRPACVEFDFGRRNADGSFQQRGLLHPPDRVLRSAVTRLKIWMDRDKPTNIPTYMQRVQSKCTKAQGAFHFPGDEYDYLFPPDYHCDVPDSNCIGCDKARAISRQTGPRENRHPVIHYGVVASGGTLTRDPSLRDQLGARLGALCIEMEAAGVTNQIPCLVVRGISDYADSHKNDNWQDYAALTAAACARQLLDFLAVKGVESKARVIDKIPRTFSVDAAIQGHGGARTEDQIRQLFPGIDLATFRSRHQEYFHKVQEGTWKWILGGEEFKTWRYQQERNVLCCVGDPGVGKSSMMSVVVNELKDQKDAALAYLYCKYHDQNQTSQSIITRLVVQLLFHLPSLPLDVAGVLNGPWNPGDILRHVCESIKSRFPDIYICIDALDEMQDRPREGLLDCLKELPPSVHILITSRLHMKVMVQRRFPTAIFQAIQPYEDDIKRHIETYIMKNATRHEKLSNEITGAILKRAAQNFLFADALLRYVLNSLTGNEVQQRLLTLPDTIEGTFTDMISRIRSGERSGVGRKALIWVALAERPITVIELQYGIAMSDDPEGIEGSKGPSHSADRGDLVDPQTLVGICLALIAIDDTDTTVRCFHRSFQDYLNNCLHNPDSPDEVRGWLLEGAHHQLAKTCLRYLELPEVLAHSRASMDNSGKQDLLLEDLPLLKYASCSWGYHTRRSDQPKELVEWATQYLSRPYADRYSSLHHLCQNLPERYRPRMTESFTLSFSDAHVAAYFGLHHVMSQLVEAHKISVDDIDACHATPLHWAAGQGHVEVVRLLLRVGVGIEPIEFAGGTPLTRALDWAATVTDRAKTPELMATMKPLSTAQAKEIIELLLASKAHVNHYYVVRGQSPRHHVCLQKEKLKRLAKKGIKNTTTLRGALSVYPLGQYRTPLMRAAESGSAEIVRILLNAGADADAGDDLGWTALHWAVRAGNEAVVKELIEQNADPNIYNEHNVRPLRLARERENASIIQYLEARTEPELATRSKRLQRRLRAVKMGRPFPALFWATQRGEISVIRSVLSKTNDINVTADNGRTALSWAAEKGQLRAIRCLLKHGADPDVKDHQGRAPLSWAAAAGSIAAVKLLVRRKANVHATDTWRRTPLAWAIINQKQPVVEFLLGMESQVDRRNWDGNTYLSWVASLGDFAVATLLLERNADVNVLNCAGSSPLMLAASNGRLETVQLLLKHGAKVDISNKSGSTALHLAARDGHNAVVDALLERGPDIHLRDNRGRSALTWAIGRGHLTVVNSLLEGTVNRESSDHDAIMPLALLSGEWPRKAMKKLLGHSPPINAQDSEGRTALSYAAAQQQLKIAHLRQRGLAVLNANIKSHHTAQACVADDPDALIIGVAHPRYVEKMHLLFWSLSKPDVNSLKSLLKNGADPNLADQKLRTPLSYAVEKGNLSAIEILLAKGADPNSIDINGRTTCSWAAAQPIGRVLQRLLRPDGLDPGMIDWKDKSGRTPLSWAAEEGNIQGAKLLISHGVRVDIKDNEGRTPLSWAVQMGRLEMVKYLRRKNADLISVTGSGRSLLSYAAESGHTDIFKLILTYDNDEDDIDIADDTGRTPLSWTGSKGWRVCFDLKRYSGGSLFGWGNEAQITLQEGPGNKEIVNLLVKRGAKLNSMDRNGRTPISWAAGNGYSSIVQALHDLGADLDTPDIRGRTPLSWAIKNGHEASINILLRHGADPSSKDNKGRSALSQALRLGKQDVAQEIFRTLLSRGFIVRTGRFGRRFVGVKTFCQACDGDIVNVSHYSCQECHECQGGDIAICQPCYRNGKRCPPGHEMSKMRLNENPDAENVA